MEGDHGRKIYSKQQESRQNYQMSGRDMTSSMMSSNNDVNSGSQGGERRLSMSGLPYPQFQGLPFDPTLYPAMQRNLLSMQHLHPAYCHSRLQQSTSGLNHVNQSMCVSPNDNNNCNRSRAASHSSVLEPHHISAHAHLPLHPIPSYLPVYYDAQKTPLPISYAPNNVASASSSGYRRNSTTSVFPPQPELKGPLMLGHLPTLTSNSNPHYAATQLPYLVGNTASLPQYSAAYKDLYHYNESRQALYRRHRYSVGALLTPSVHMTNIAEARRRNSIPTGLEIQQISDESSSVDDDDDVFDEPAPTEPLQSARNAATFLEQLRESRKRALSAGEPSTSRAKYVCRDTDVDAPLPRPARFRRRITHDEESDVTSVSEARGTHSDHHASSMQTVDRDMPGRSNSMHHENESVTTISASQTPRPHVGGTSTSRTSNITEVVTKPEASILSPPSLSSTHPLPRTMTPSPSILKNSSRKTRVNGTNENSKNSEANCQSQFTPVRTKTLPLKKQVAWRDTQKLTTKIAPTSVNDVIISPMKHDLLTKLNLIEIRKNPREFISENRIGPYIFGPQIGSSPVRSITQYLVRKEHSYKYYMAKVLIMRDTTSDNKSGRMLLFSEHSLLNLLKNHPGVVRQHGFHKDVAYDKITGKVQERLCLILDCLAPHDFDKSSYDFLNLQQYVIEMKRLSERETIKIFLSIIDVVLSLHELNVVHRDLKLSNMVLHKKTQKAILTNFCLGRHLITHQELLKDQRGSPAYISPDVLSGKPYAGKPSDMWSLGVVLYMMLYGKFPFYDQEPLELYRKIKKADFVIPSDIHTTSNINDIIRGLLTLDPSQRLTAHDTLLALHRCANVLTVVRYPQLEAQVVPDVDDKESSSEDDEDKNDELEHQRYLEEKLTRDFEKKMLSDDEGDAGKVENQTKGFSHFTYQSKNPSARHLTYDARPLTQEELTLHRQLLANSTLGVRVQSST